MASARHYTQSFTKDSVQTPMYAMHLGPSTVNNSIPSYETQQNHCNSLECECNSYKYRCNSHECQCNSHKYRCNSHQCQCNSHQCQCNSHQCQYNEYCESSNRQYQHQYHHPNSLQDHGVQSRFRFHDMAHGNTLSKFSQPKNTWNMMIQTPMQVARINQDMVSTDDMNRQMVSSKTPMQHQMYWYGY
jgi:hypothetical protein